VWIGISFFAAMARPTASSQRGSHVRMHESIQRRFRAARNEPIVVVGCHGGGGNRKQRSAEAIAAGVDLAAPAA